MAISTEERRIVTVLFADMAGSTALGEQLDPEEMRGLLSRYYTIARETITEYGGTVEKFIGDAVMAVFGLPTAHGDDPDRAIAAAAAMRQRIQDDPQLNGRVAIRVGISTGEVVASRDQSAGDFLITGDATNVAARLQQGADTWSILVSDRTARSAANFDFGDELLVEAKGKSAPVAARQVIGPKKVSRQKREKLPLVGRENDLEQLQLVARRAVRDKRPSMVSVIAPAGTGKTRLVEEFLGWLPMLGAERDRGHRPVPALRPAAHLLANAPGPVPALRPQRGHAACQLSRGARRVAARPRGRGGGTRCEAARRHCRRDGHRGRGQGLSSSPRGAPSSKRSRDASPSSSSSKISTGRATASSTWRSS